MSHKLRKLRRFGRYLAEASVYFTIEDMREFENQMLKQLDLVADAI